MIHRSGPTRSRTSGRGFTLIEVLITMALMTIVLPVAMRGVSVAVAAANSARRTAEASVLAQSVMNELLTTTDPSTFSHSGDFGDEWPGYQWNMNSFYEADLGLTSYTITVTWSERGQPRSFNVSTMLADPPEATEPI